MLIEPYINAKAVLKTVSEILHTIQDLVYFQLSLFALSFLHLFLFSLSVSLLFAPTFPAKPNVLTESAH